MPSDSVYDEPQFRDDPPQAACGDEPVADDIVVAQELPVGQGVRDEPSTSVELAGEQSADARTYRQWLLDGVERTSALKSWAIVFCLVLVSGVWSVIGAVLNQITGMTLWGLLLVVLIGPLSEEMMKASATLITIEKWPYIFRSQVQIVLCCMAAGAGFSALENLLYLHVYISDASRTIIMWRWTVCMLMHTGCSLIVSLGLIRVWKRVMESGRSPQVSLATPYIIAGAALHGSYNFIAILLSPVLR